MFEGFISGMVVRRDVAHLSYRSICLFSLSFSLSSLSACFHILEDTHGRLHDFATVHTCLVLCCWFSGDAECCEVLCCTSALSHSKAPTNMRTSLPCSAIPAESVRPPAREGWSKRQVAGFLARREASDASPRPLYPLSLQRRRWTPTRPPRTLCCCAQLAGR